MSIARDSDRHPMRPVNLQAPDGWYAAKISLRFPTEGGDKVYLTRKTAEILQVLRDSPKTQRTACLHLNTLCPPKLAKGLATHGRAWRPEIGLGVLPEDPPPRLWSSADFLDRQYDEPVPELMQNVIFLHGEESTMQTAYECMTGSGGLIQVLHSVPRETLQSTWYDALQPRMTEPGLAAFSTYIPLLSEQSFRDVLLLNEVLRPVDLYLRENADRNEVFIISRQNFGRFVQTTE